MCQALLNAAERGHRPFSGRTYHAHRYDPHLPAPAWRYRLRHLRFDAGPPCPLWVAPGSPNRVVRLCGHGSARECADGLSTLNRVIPFPVHGRVELASVPALLLVPATMGALKGDREQGYFIGLAGTVLSVYTLTDWKADPNT